VTAAQVTELGAVEGAPQAVLSIEVRDDGVAVVVLDDARAVDNTITPALQAQLVDALGRIEADATLAAVVLTSGKSRGFVAGLDPAGLTSIKFSSDAERSAFELGNVFAQIEASRKPVVAAVHGAALGAGFGLALACHAIVASDDPATVFGLPETRVGLVSIGNAVLRVANRAGLRVTLDVLSRGARGASGSVLPAVAALDLDLVDEVCPQAILIEAAARHARALVGRVPRVRDERAGIDAIALEKNALGRGFLFRRARARADEDAKDQRRGHVAASLAIDVVQRFADKGFDEAARLEARIFGELVVTETAHRLIELAVTRDALDRDAGASERTGARPARRVVVVGGGSDESICAGIAYVTAAAGLAVRLKERDDVALGRALRATRALVDAGAGAGPRERENEREREELFGRVAATTDYAGLRNADAVIEAVPEELALKQAVLHEVEGRIGPRCVYGSSTASIAIARIAQGSPTPERVLGLHYFAPVHEAPLLEVVRADKTAPWAVAAAVALGRRQGKTVIVVRDGPGFYTTRILVPYLSESLRLLGDGVSGDAIDGALSDWGFAMGPLRRLDETGIDVVGQIAQALHASLGSRMTPPGAFATLVSHERRGRKSGRGLFRDSRGRGGKRVMDATVYPLLGVEPRTRLPNEEIAQRCALAMVNEAVRCLGDGVLRDAREGDIGAVYGLGFPRFRGGPFRYVDTIGAADVLRRVQGYADRFGDRWRPAPLLVQMARRGERFFG
jgi:3-hydroxyacyl-CoA dehydrogenase/enoyl-CoA hydratase/3-hydroxybutyryl-CoA epimerase